MSKTLPFVRPGSRQDLQAQLAAMTAEEERGFLEAVEAFADLCETTAASSSLRPGVVNIARVLARELAREGVALKGILG